MPMTRSSRLYLCYHVICSTCFGYLYAHHQELETILVLLPHMACNALVVGGRRSGVGQQDMCPGWRKLLEQLPSSRTHSLLPCSWQPTTSNQGANTICGNNTSRVSSSWWWAYKWSKHVEQLTSAINHSVASSWFPSLRICDEISPKVLLIFISFPHKWKHMWRVYSDTNGHQHSLPTKILRECQWNFYVFHINTGRFI